MDNKLHFKKISDFESFCERNFSDISTNEILIGLGAGFDISAYQHSPSWNSLNILGLKTINSEWGDLLNEPRINSLGPHLLSSYVFEKLKGEKTEKTEKNKETTFIRLLKPLQDQKINHKNDSSLQSIGLSNASIITTNYRLPKPFNENRIKVDLTELNERSFQPKMIFAHGEIGKNKIIYSEEQFDDHYNGSRKSKMAETLRTQGTKLVALFGFSGRDTSFMNLIKESFKDQSVRIYFFTGDFNVNRREADLFNDVVKVLYKFNLITYDYETAPLIDMVKAILLSSKGNTRKEILDEQWKYLVDKASSKKQNQINFVFEKIQSPSLGYNIRTLAKHILKLNPTPTEIMSSRFNDFTKLTIIEEMIITKNADAETIKTFLSIRNHDYVDERLVEPLLKFIRGCNDDILNGEILFIILAKDRKSKRLLSPLEYKLIKNYTSSIKENEDWSFSYVHKWPGIKISTMKDVQVVLSAASKDAASVSMNILNLSDGDEMSVVISALKDYFTTVSDNTIEKQLRDLSVEIKNDTYNEDPGKKWKILGYAYVSSKKEVSLSKIWSNTHPLFCSLLVYFSSLWKKIIIDIPEKFEAMVSDPQDYFMYGIMSKNNEWKESMLSYIESNETWIDKYATRKERYSSAISNFDLEEIDKIQSEISSNWTSRTRGDGEIDALEREYETLIEKSSFDLDHVYQSWINNNEIELKPKIISLFKDLKSLNKDTIFDLYDKYREIESISDWIKSKSKDIISSENDVLSMSYFEKYVSIFTNKKAFRESLSTSIKEGESSFFNYIVRDLIEILRNQMFSYNNDERKKPNHEINYPIFSKFIELMGLTKEQSDVLLLSNAYYIFSGAKKPVEIMKNSNLDKHFVWNVLNSNITYYSKKDNVLLANFYKTLEYKKPTDKNSIVRHNQRFHIAAAFYRSDMIEEIIDIPDLVDALVEFIYTNKKISKNYSNNNKLMSKADFSKTNLWRMRDKELLEIPRIVFKKIMENSAKIKLSKIIEYTNEKPNMQKNKKVLDNIHNGIYKTHDYDLRRIEHSNPELSPKNNYYKEARISIK